MIPVLADVVWPALYIMARSYTWWGIALGLVIEYFVLRLLSKATWQKMLIVVLAANALTSVIGLVGTRRTKANYNLASRRDLVDDRA
jgi:integral membrane sensor domain MASE1